MPGVDGLRAALEALPLRIDDVSVDFAAVPLRSYPDGARPSSNVTLSGDGRSGCGEHVGWTEHEHAAFRAAAAGVPRGAMPLGEFSHALRRLPAYDRAALEAAAVDLALRQHDTNLFRLAAASPTPVRYVVSYACVADPAAAAEAVVPRGIELKIDADGNWTDAIYEGLAALGRVAVLDFKLSGRVSDGERACRLLPGAWIEDPPPGPWSPALVARFSADAAVTGVAALDGLAARPGAVNVKPARMGGVLEAIECLALCRDRGIATYIGGMFEVGAARRQLLTLAALACADGPNDIAPLIHSAPSPDVAPSRDAAGSPDSASFPPRLLPDRDGFGFGGSAGPSA